MTVRVTKVREDGVDDEQIVHEAERWLEAVAWLDGYDDGARLGQHVGDGVPARWRDADGVPWAFYVAEVTEG